MKSPLPRPSRLASLATLGLLALGAFLAPSAIAADQPVKIGFVVKQPEEPWFVLEWKFAGQAAKDLGFTLIKIGATDGDKVLSAIDNLAANGAQGFVICTPDTRLGPGIVAKAKSDNLKLITVDDQLIGADGKPMLAVHHLGISATKIGQKVGATLIEQMKQRGWAAADTAVCAVTFEELATAKERTDGAIDAILASGFAKDRIYKAPQRTSDIPGAFDAVTILLTQKPAVKHWLICGMNDSAVLGAVRAIEQRGFTADSCVGVGINGTDCIAELERTTPTSFYGSMLNSAKAHGYQTAEMMFHWIKDGKEPPLDTRTVSVLITRDNFRQVLKEQGIRD